VRFASTRSLRGKRGATISEVGPSLFVIFIFGLLPAVDALFLGLDYASAYTLNELQLREAQKSPKSQVMRMDGPVVQTIPQQWKSSLVGGFVPSLPNPQTNISYAPVPWQPVGGNQTLDFWFVSITTTVTYRPFFAIPFLNGVPGLGAPVTMTVTNRRPVENNRYLNE
jgi:hypothetical protein